MAFIEAFSSVRASVIEGVLSLLGIGKGTDFAQKHVTITAPMANGAAPVLAANANRCALVITPPRPCALALHPGIGGNPPEGTVPLLAQESKILTGSACPKNALYVTGLQQGDRLLLEEGEYG